MNGTARRARRRARQARAIFRAEFALPQNGPEGLKGEVYSFDYGPVHCVMLDTQTKLEEQATWLEGDLAASHAPWKLVLPPQAALSGAADTPQQGREGGLLPDLRSLSRRPGVYGA